MEIKKGKNLLKVLDKKYGKVIGGIQNKNNGKDYREKSCQLGEKYLKNTDVHGTQLYLNNFEAQTLKNNCILESNLNTSKDIINALREEILQVNRLTNGKVSGVKYNKFLTSVFFSKKSVDYIIDNKKYFIEKMKDFFPDNVNARVYATFVGIAVSKGVEVSTEIHNDFDTDSYPFTKAKQTIKEQMTSYYLNLADIKDGDNSLTVYPNTNEVNTIGSAYHFLSNMEERYIGLDNLYCNALKNWDAKRQLINDLYRYLYKDKNITGVTPVTKVPEGYFFDPACLHSSIGKQINDDSRVSLSIRIAKTIKPIVEYKGTSSELEKLIKNCGVDRNDFLATLFGVNDFSSYNLEELISHEIGFKYFLLEDTDYKKDNQPLVTLSTLSEVYEKFECNKVLLEHNLNNQSEFSSHSDL